jgi:Zn-dependent protease
MGTQRPTSLTRAVEFAGNELQDETLMSPVINILRAPILIVVLIFSVVIHEVSHGVTAEKLGDPTARRLGRITLNPLPHIDLLGSIIIPAIGALVPGAPLIGWAKPVPVEVRYFKDPIRDFAMTALAGPASNMAQVLVYSLILHAGIAMGWTIVAFIGSWGVYINLLLALFNLLPVPPLDGSRLVAAALPRDMSWRYLSLGKYGFVVLMLLLFTGVLRPLYMLVEALHSAIVS